MSEEKRERFKTLVEEIARERYEGTDISWGDCENPNYVEGIHYGYHGRLTLDAESIAVIGLGEFLNGDDGEEGGENDGDGDNDGEDGCSDD